MKRRTIIGLSVTILALSVIIGIASLPDEVLIESSSIDNSANLPEEIIVPTEEQIQDAVSNEVDMETIDNTNAEVDAMKQEITELKNELAQIKTNSEVPKEESTLTEKEDVTIQENPPEDSQGKVITINIRDGVGSKSK